MAYLFKRGSVYYMKFYVAGKQKEKSLGTGVYQIAKEKQRLFESARARGEIPAPDAADARPDSVDADSRKPFRWNVCHTRHQELAGLERVIEKVNKISPINIAPSPPPPPKNK